MLSASLKQRYNETLGESLNRSIPVEILNIYLIQTNNYYHVHVFRIQKRWPLLTVSAPKNILYFPLQTWEQSSAEASSGDECLRPYREGILDSAISSILGIFTVINLQSAIKLVRDKSQLISGCADFYKSNTLCRLQI